MGITYTTKKGTSTTYAYETTSVWDQGKKKTTTHRKYLGRVDPTTNNIIASSGKKGRKKRAEDPFAKLLVENQDYKALYEEAIAKSEALSKELAEAKMRITELNKQLVHADKALRHCEKAIQSFRGFIDKDKE